MADQGSSNRSSTTRPSEARIDNSALTSGGRKSGVFEAEERPVSFAAEINPTLDISRLSGGEHIRRSSSVRSENTPPPLMMNDNLSLLDRWALKLLRIFDLLRAGK